MKIDQIIQETIGFCRRRLNNLRLEFQTEYETI